MVMARYLIFTTAREEPFEVIGKRRPDLETNNWHYYESEGGQLCHFRKEYMVAVFGGTENKLNVKGE